MDAFDLDTAVRSLVDDYRSRCLWFLRIDYYPSSAKEIARVLEWIRRYGDVPAYRRAAEIERWLSLRSSATSASS
ncbi:MAG: hypothetical protein WC538_08590 [Thermoanaerobaculia bacterium]|jgi:hypothetical protein